MLGSFGTYLTKLVAMATHFDKLKTGGQIHDLK